MEKDPVAESPATEHVDQYGRQIELSRVMTASDEGTTVDNAVATEIEPEDAEELRRIATVFSQASGAGGQPADLSQAISFNNASDDSLNPQSKNFDPAKWVQNVVRQIEGRGIRPARTGIMFKDLTVSGTGDAVQLQQTVGSLAAGPLRPGEFFHFGSKAPKRILNKFDGLLRHGELLIVLGRPGSGCSTMLKTMSGELNGLSLDKTSTISYDGIPQTRMKKEFKGEVIYNQEVDKHFPHLTVGQTLEFAAAVRTPSDRMEGLSRNEYSKLMAQVVMAICGLTQTYNTKVGNDFVRGVSGGERKRVSIAEMMLAGSPFAAWDNRYVYVSKSPIFLFMLTLLDAVPEVSIQPLPSNLSNHFVSLATFSDLPTPLPYTKPARQSTTSSTKQLSYMKAVKFTTDPHRKPDHSLNDKDGIVLHGRQRETS